MASNKRDICVIGTGRFGRAVVEELVAQKKYVLAVDKDEQALTEASRIASTAVVDGGDIEGLRALGLSKFKTVIVATSDNIEIVAALIELNVKHIIAKANSPRQQRVLNIIGCDVIIRPEYDAGRKAAMLAIDPEWIKFTENIQDIGDGYSLVNTNVNALEWLDKKLRDLNFSKIGVSIVSIKRGLKVIIPSGDVQLRKDDKLTIIGKTTSITKALRSLNTDDSTKEIETKNKKRVMRG